jgi:hypothetical protein
MARDYDAARLGRMPQEHMASALALLEPTISSKRTQQF